MEIAEESTSLPIHEDGGVTPSSLVTNAWERRKPLIAASAHDESQVQALPMDASTSLVGSRDKTKPDLDTAVTTSSEVDPTLPQTEKLLAHHRLEQEDLTASLYTMAQALKASSQAFASSLELEKDVVDRATDTLSKNTTGMEAAEKRMGTLRRMTEGRGWWGRMLLYAYIMGMMAIAIFIVAFLPKLRF